ncbi:MAG TPA: histone deacetylase [Dehalococcoidia bacterium]|nr:histone deacetylase [Dehalococcoidia bacterium]
MKRLCLIYQPAVVEHSFGAGHPLLQERLPRYLAKLREDGLIDHAGIEVVDPPDAVGEDEILAVHDRSLLERIKELSARGGLLDGDTPVPVGTYERARLQAGGLLYGAKSIMEGQYDRAVQMLAFGGHHAMRRHQHITFGFCYFNQEAIVIKALQSQGYLQRALIMDCDCHHGNGIQDIFYADPSVLYISLHQDPRTLYPGWMGHADEVGEGAGRGYNVNVPLPPGTQTQSYMRVLEQIFPPLAREFAPQLILAIINGDTHFADPLTDMGIDLSCYSRIARLISEVSEEVCGGRLVVELGGGYDLGVAVNGSCKVTAELVGYEGYEVDDPYGIPGPEPAHITQRVEKLLEERKATLSRYWKVFRA